MLTTLGFFPLMKYVIRNTFNTGKVFPFNLVGLISASVPTGFICEHFVYVHKYEYSIKRNVILKASICNKILEFVVLDYFKSHVHSSQFSFLLPLLSHKHIYTHHILRLLSGLVLHDLF